MAESIRISVLGRDVRVGDFYNYFTDSIIPSKIRVPEEFKSISESKDKPKFSYLYQMPDKFKRFALNINSHLYDSIKKGYLDKEKLWLSDYLLDTNLSDEDEGSEAQVTVFIQIIRGTETLDSQYFSSRMHQDQVLKSDERGTHLIQEVAYGIETICSIRKSVDRKRETKESVERNLYLAAKDYLEQGLDRDSATTPIPFELNDVTCIVLNSLQIGKKMHGKFQEFSQYLRSWIHYRGETTIWKPVEIVLRYIPDPIEIQLRFERKKDILFLTEQNQVMWDWITRESRNLLRHSHLDRFPTMKRVMHQFNDLLLPFEKKTKKLHEIARTPEQTLDNMKPISDMIDWLAQRQKDIEVFSFLLNETQLVALDLENIKTRARETEEKFHKVFVLKVEYKENTLVDEMLEKIEDPASALELPMLTVTRLEKDRLAQVRRKLHEFVKEADLKSGNPTRDYHLALVPSSPSYSLLYDGAIEFYDYSHLVSEKSLMTLGDPVDSLENQLKSPSRYSKLHPLTLDVLSTNEPQLRNALTCLENYDYHSNEERENPNQMDLETYSFLTDSDGMEGIDESSNKASDVSSKPLADEFIPERTKVHPSTQQEIDSNRITTNTHNKTRNSTKIANTGNAATAASRDLVCFVTVSNEIEIDTQDGLVAASTHDRERSTIRSDSSCREEETKQYHETDSNAGGSACETNRKQEVRHSQYESDKDTRLHEEPPLNPNIAAVFTSRKYSTLIELGQPNVYLLNAKETSFGEDYRCFDIGHWEQDSSRSIGLRNHKVIILLGATGCGKSTLINGMVNYILGVKWNDPFRFKCVREDETAARNQAHSQTNSVTAYTIHHHDGMTVPYSLTIVDTPGYGDTRGVKRDKEITRKIHQFLTQQETRVDEIHAGCFVAASGNSRLTTTQCYIIDSVLSIFGKDVKENIRLLVTFADNAHPPVVDACLAAHFPVTSASDGITYSKFNSSVLYANNEREQDNSFSFDELFWNMGEMNFRKFFSMLEGMNGKNLKSTRDVIQSRGLLEQSLKDIEQELEICFVNIENKEILHRKMKDYGYKMESNKNFIFEQTEMRPIESPCKGGFFAYNCRHCRKTCERPVKKIAIEKLQNMKRKCNKNSCNCPDYEHEYQQFEWIMSPVKTTKTLEDVKAEYEANYNRKMSVEQLLADCSHELEMARAKVFSLLDQVGENVRLLESTALRSNALTPSDYLSLMKSRVAEEQAPGYLTRLETLTELQNCLAAEASASASDITAFRFPNQTHRSSKAGGASRREDYGHRSKTFQIYQHSTEEDRMANSTSAGASNYFSESNTRTASGLHVSQHNNQRAALTVQGIYDKYPLTNPKPFFSSDSKQAYSPSVYQGPPKKGGLFSFFFKEVKKN